MSGPWHTIQHKTAPLSKAIDPEERDFRISLRLIERNAILPLKWTIFFTAAVFWGLSHRHAFPPPVNVFALFTAYFMFNLGATYFLVLNRVTLSQIRIMSVVSYYIDVLFVTLLIYLETNLYPATDSTSTDFYIYYFILILRGFALFRTPQGNLLANAVIAVVFIWSLFWQDADLLSYSSRNNLIRVIFIWVIILMSWFIVQVINRQKAELLRTREKLVQSENLALVGELAAGVAHEINNPISIISTYSDFLSRNSAPDDDRKNDYEVIHAEATRCENIVKELLAYARPASNEAVPTDLADLNDQVLQMIVRKKQGDAQLKVERHYAPELPHPYIDPSQLKQALLNIYLNAIQAMENVESPTLVTTITNNTHTNRVTIAVTDNGTGIDPQDLRRIFDPFFTTHARGTGLGMSITRRLIEAAGGQIHIASKKGKGTTVELVIPYEHSVPS